MYTALSTFCMFLATSVQTLLQISPSPCHGSPAVDVVPAMLGHFLMVPLDVQCKHTELLLE